MSKKTMSIAMIVLGLILLAVSLVADLLGLGAGPGIGWKQLSGAAIGLIVTLGGLWLASRKPISTK